MPACSLRPQRRTVTCVPRPAALVSAVHWLLMQLRQLETLDAYLQVLRNVPEEALALANECVRPANSSGITWVSSGVRR